MHLDHPSLVDVRSLFKERKGVVLGTNLITVLGSLHGVNPI